MLVQISRELSVNLSEDTQSLRSTKSLHYAASLSISWTRRSAKDWIVDVSDESMIREKHRRGVMGINWCQQDIIWALDLNAVNLEMIVVEWAHKRARDKDGLKRLVSVALLEPCLVGMWRSAQLQLAKGSQLASTMFAIGFEQQNRWNFGWIDPYRHAARGTPIADERHNKTNKH